jgi:hypothetical protein
VTSFSTPEEAARGNLREEYVRVVGVAIRGDQAVVAQIMNADSYPSAYEIETAMCYRTSEGWELASSGNYNIPFIPTGDDRCTAVWWDEAPEGVSGARIRLGNEEQEVRVRDGFFFVTFDDVALRNAEIRANWPRPTVEEWIRASDDDSR